MLRRYLTPITGDGQYHEHGDGKELDVFRPKYFGDMQGVDFYAEYYGLAPLFLVEADLTDYDHALVIKNEDVFVFPDNPKEPIDPVKMKSFWAANRLPSDFLSADWTHEEALAKVEETFRNAQVIHGMHLV